MIINLNGRDCLVVAQAANIPPQILDTTTGAWRPSKSLTEARRHSDTDPSTVRLNSDPRVLIEDILKMSIPTTDTSLADVIAKYPDNEALQIIGAQL